MPSAVLCRLCLSKTRPGRNTISRGLLLNAGEMCKSLWNKAHAIFIGCLTLANLNIKGRRLRCALSGSERSRGRPGWERGQVIRLRSLGTSSDRLVSRLTALPPRPLDRVHSQPGGTVARGVWPARIPLNGAETTALVTRRSPELTTQMHNR